MSATFLTLSCLAATAGLLLAERRGPAAARALLKMTASACFVLLAITLDAAASVYGRWILAALVLGALGDALLLSDRPRFFLAGLAAFLVAHACFAGAFLSGGFARGAAALALLPALAVGVAVVRWLWPHLGRDFRAPVLAYVATILLMCAAAAGCAAAGGRWGVLAGALLFAASDIAVARDRFVAPGFFNKAWGLPTYYAAQLLLAGSVAT